MLDRRQLMTAGLGLTAAAVMANAAQAQDQSSFKLSYQGSHPPNQAYITITGQGFRDLVEKLSNGRITFEVYDVGALVGVTGMLEAADQGVLDISQSWGGYYSGDLPEADVECGLPMAWSQPWEAYDAFYNRGMGELIANSYESAFNVKYFPAIISLSYGVSLREPVTSLADLDGKKIRAIGLFGEFVQALGAAPSVIPAPELYTALQLGTVDGLVYGAEAVAAGSLQDFVKSMILAPNWNTGVGHWVINRNTWDSLPLELQQVIEFAAHYGNMAHAMQYSAAEAKMTADLVAQGVDLVQLSAEDVATLRSAAHGIWDTVAARNEVAAKAVEIVKQQQADYGRV